MTKLLRAQYDFLQQFFKGHKQYLPLEFYAFGESYGGHYVPAVTHRVWQGNQNLVPGAVKINLKGTSVGNGLTDPEIQCAAARLQSHLAVLLFTELRYCLPADSPALGTKLRRRTHPHMIIIFI